MMHNVMEHTLHSFLSNDVLTRGDSLLMICKGEETVMVHGFMKVVGTTNVTAPGGLFSLFLTNESPGLYLKENSVVVF